MSIEITPGPPRIQIQTQAGCNGRCVFCPNEQLLAANLPQGKMPVDMFHKIIDELAQVPPRRIGLYLMNEPLLDERLPDFVRHVTERIPSTKTQIITNGTFLDEPTAEALLDAGIQQVKVSLQSLDPETNRKLMGYPSEGVIENCINFQKLLKRKRVKNLDFRISMIVTSLNVEKLDDIRAFWRKHGIRLVTSALENRGGNIAQAASLNPHEMKSMGDCIRPSRDFAVLYNGDAVLCCVDWLRTTILGNVGEQSIQEIWHGDALERIRAGLRERDASKLPKICLNCAESAAPNFHRRNLKGILSRILQPLSR